MTYSFFDLQEKTEDMYIVKHLVHLGILKMLFVVEWNDSVIAGILHSNCEHVLIPKKMNKGN